MISKLNLDVVDTHNFKTLGLVDTSWYNPNITIETPTLQILVPGFSKYVSPAFVPKSLNIFNSNSVGLTNAGCEQELIELPDGLWKIKYSICPNDKLFIEKIFLRTDKLLCRYTQAFLTLDLEKMSEDKERQKRRALEEAELYFKYAHAAANNKDYKSAKDFYKKSDKLLSKYLTNRDVCG
jgi:hypothetical protein